MALLERWNRAEQPPPPLCVMPKKNATMNEDSTKVLPAATYTRVMGRHVVQDDMICFDALIGLDSSDVF